MMVLNFKRKTMIGQTVHLSVDVLVPYSSNPSKSHTKVEKFAILKQPGSDDFEVGVWDGKISNYDLLSYANCNSKTLRETIEKVSARYRAGR